ncbi:hypothetical protein GQ457_10G003970 [Hibiscus cannabinus]
MLLHNIKIVDDRIHELFLEYVALPLPLTPTYAEEGNAGNGKTSNQQMKSELDQYLEEYRSFLRPETTEALICANDWLRYGSEVNLLK